MQNMEIVEGSINDLKDVFTRLEVDFNSNERKDYAHLELLMMKNRYKLLLAKHTIFNEIIGYAFIYRIDNDTFLWLDYLAIDSQFRDGGYGSFFFNAITENQKEETLGVFLEVEIPGEIDGEAKDKQNRRIQFYERLGAIRLELDYQLPTIEGGYPMYLYFKPCRSLRALPKEQIREAIRTVFEDIHSDIGQRDLILKTVLGTIQDKSFY